MIELRKMTRHDVGLGMRLKAQAGWNQTEADWGRFLGLEPGGCFVAMMAGRAVGTVTAFVFGRIGWIAMVLVEQESRGRGIGGRLVAHALEYLESRGVQTARLDATALGRPIYERFGFVAEYELVRMQGVCRATVGDWEVCALQRERLGDVLALDRKVTGTDRGFLFEALYRERPDALRAFVADEDVLGYLTIRDGACAVQIGPGMACTEEAGRALMGDALFRCDGEPVFLDIPVVNRAAVTCAESHGLVVQRRFMRMRRGDPVDDDPARLWASSGPEKG